METLSPLRKWATLLVLTLALAIIIIDTTVLNVALATIIREFQTTIQNIQWVITAYSLTLAALTITGGRLGDFFGRKKMFVIGAIIFAIGSTITSFSHNVPTMIWGEAIIEGIGAALMAPATASLLVSTFQGRERAIAFGIWGGIAAAAAAIGPIIGGYFTTNYSWRWAFRINIFVALLLVVGSMIIREARDTEEKPSFDFLGVILSSLGLLGLVFGVIEASQYGWWFAKAVFSLGSHNLNFGRFSIVPFSLLIGAIFLSLFFFWQAKLERQGKTPLLSLKLFKNRQFTSGGLTTLITSLGLSGLIFTVPIFLQAVRRLDAFHTGLALLPMSLTLLVVAPVSGFLSHRIKPRTLIQIGLFLTVLAFFVLRQTVAVEATATTFIPGLMLFGFGMGMVFSQVNNITLSAVSVQQAGEAAGVSNTLRQVGSTLGAAIIGSVMLTALALNMTSGIKASSVIPTSLKPGLTQLAVAQTSNIEFGGGVDTSQPLPVAVKSELLAIGRQATVDADKRAFIFGALFAFLGLIVSFFLPNSQNIDQAESVAVKSKTA